MLFGSTCVTHEDEAQYVASDSGQVTISPPHPSVTTDAIHRIVCPTATPYRQRDLRFEKSWRSRMTVTASRRRLLVMVLHARVKNGHFVIDEATDLPEGSVIELVPVDKMMPDDELAALDSALEAGAAQVARGETVDADEVLRRFRAKP